MQPRHVPRLQAAASETASLLSSREHQATDTLGATKQEEKGRGSVRPAPPRGLEEHGVLRLLLQGRGTTGRGHSIVAPDGRAGEPHVHRARLRGSRISNWAGGKIPPYIREEAAASPSAQTAKQSHKKH